MTRTEQTTIPAVSIWLNRAEGPTELCGDVTLTGPDLWARADAQIREWATTAPQENGQPYGYDKTDFRVTFADGETYTGRYDIEWNDRGDLAAHIREFVTWCAQPENAQRLELTDEQKAEYASWLDIYALTDGEPATAPAPEPGSMADLFGPVIHAYTRADAIADGALIDVTDTAREAGFRWPTVLTAAAWHDCVRWTTEDEKRKPEGTGQDEAGRLWDVLWMGANAIRRTYGRVGGPLAGDGRLNYQLLRIPTGGRGLRPRLVVLSVHVGPGDDGEPAVTIMLPSED